MVIPVIPAVAAIAADPTATSPVLAVSAVAAVPEQIIFGLHAWNLFSGESQRGFA